MTFKDLNNSRSWLLVLIAALVVACDAGSFLMPPTDGEEREPSTLRLYAELSSQMVTGLSVQVDGPDIDPALVFNIPISDGVANGTVRVTAGSDRRFVLTAYDAGGVETHRGGDTVDIVAGENPPLEITMEPLQGDREISATIGSFIVAVSPAVDSIMVDEEIQLTAVVIDSMGDTISDATLHWASLAPEVAAVSLHGLVSGLGSGTAQIIATYGTVGGSARIEVLEAQTPVASVAVSPEQDTLGVAETLQLTATVLDEEGNELTDRAVSWASGDPGIADVSQEGLVTAVAEGQIDVSATVDGVTGSAAITVVDTAGGSLTISPPDPDTLYGIADSLTLTVEARAADGSLISEPDVQWSSQDPDIATVDDMGTVIARALGTTVISASAVCCTGDFVELSVVEDTVDTTDPGTVTDLEVIAVGEDYVTLQWTEVDDGTGEPANYAIRFDSPTLSWGAAYESEVSLAGTSIGEPITYTFTELASATEYEFGLVSYRGTLNDGAIFGGTSNFVSATTDHTPESSVTVSPSSLRLEEVGQTATLTVEVRESDGSLVENPEVTWTSQDTDIATVDENGMVTARALGTTLIVASTVCCGEGTTDLTVGANDLHPNEPAGMTVLGNADGSVAAAEDGSVFGIAAFGSYSGSGSLEVVDDPDNPTGSGKAVRVHWTADGSGKADMDLNATIAEPTVLYIAYRIIIPSSWDTDVGPKWMYIEPDGGGNPGDAMWTSQGTGTPPVYWQMLDGENSEIWKVGDVIPRDEEVLLEMVLVMESAPGAGDGEAYAYLDGSLIGSHTGVRVHVGSSYNAFWGNIHLYNNANQEDKLAGEHFDVREFYVSAK